LILLILSIVIICQSFNAVAGNPKFKVIAFYTGKNDPAHVSFVHEANSWFAKIADKYRFSYDSTDKNTNGNYPFGVVPISSLANIFARGVRLLLSWLAAFSFSSCSRIPLLLLLPIAFRLSFLWLYHPAVPSVFLSDHLPGRSV
jgi:hypothetical protein